MSSLSKDTSLTPALSSLERQMIDVFVDGVKVIGLPKSLGEIYGLLYISPEALSLDDVAQKLGLSKGSASQGLRMLRALGAVKEAGQGGRRTLYVPDVDLKRLVGGFIREQVRPHLESGRTKVRKLLKNTSELDDAHLKMFYRGRIHKLDSWMNRGRVVLPLIQRMLGE